jgi:hypothetical protein
MSIDKESFNRLKEIKATMEDLIEEAGNIVRCADRNEYNRAKGYWIGWIEHALNNINPYDQTMDKTIKALNPGEEDEDCDDDVCDDVCDDTGVDE